MVDGLTIGFVLGLYDCGKYLGFCCISDGDSVVVGSFVGSSEGNDVGSVDGFCDSLNDGSEEGSNVGG